MVVRIRKLVQWRPPRWTRGWIGLLLFGALFVGHTVAIAAANRFAGGLVAPQSRCIRWRVVQAFETPQGLQIVHWWDDAYEQPWYDPDTVQMVADVYLWPDWGWRPFREGAWAATRRVWKTQFGRSLPEYEPLVRAQAHEWMLAEYAEYNIAITPERAEWLRRFAAGAGHATDIIWTGYLHNLLACILFGMSARASLHTFGDAARGLYHRLRSESFEAAIARGHCPGCRYDIRGLPASICPECGGSLAPPGDDVTPDA